MRSPATSKVRAGRWQALYRHGDRHGHQTGGERDRRSARRVDHPEQGDNVNKGDVVQSGSDSTLGITSSTAPCSAWPRTRRWVLNEMIYDPNGRTMRPLFSWSRAPSRSSRGDRQARRHEGRYAGRDHGHSRYRGAVEIDFEVPGQAARRQAKFQVLVEPDGTTGSYILFDKTTLNPIATVNQAGTQTIINGQAPSASIGGAAIAGHAKAHLRCLCAEIHAGFESQIRYPFYRYGHPAEHLRLKFADGTPVTATAQFIVVPDKTTSTTSHGTGGIDHIPGPPTVHTFDSAFTETAGATHSAGLDTFSNKISFADINAGDCRRRARSSITSPTRTRTTKTSPRR